MRDRDSEDLRETILIPLKAMKPSDIRELRKRENLSQSVFACYLNVSKNIISEWERGIKRPSGPSMRLLSMLQERGLEIFKRK